MGVALNLWGFEAWQWLALVQHELLLFAGIFFLIGAIDDFAVDIAWLWLKVTGRARTTTIDRNLLRQAPLHRPSAIFIPAWQEHTVIGDTVKHALGSWPQPNLRLYVGCYRNDPKTIAAIMKVAGGDRRLRIVIHDRDGPSTKADCLNRLYQALCHDERRSGVRFGSVVFHDAEDMVDPAGLGLLDRAIENGADFAQLPVEPLAQPQSRWLGSHYCEEFAEAHGKAMVVRDALGVGLPAAGVGCAVSRAALDRLCDRRADDLPFAAESLTEDYELGLGVAETGGVCRFVRARGQDGLLIATRAFFPAELETVVRQKTRWVHGIALQGWDRTGWGGGLADAWMRARDRRGPFTAIVLLVGYSLLILAALGWAVTALGFGEPMELSALVKALLIVNFGAFLWRALWRFAFTAREYGLDEGLMAVLRIPVANVIAIMAGRRAVLAYARTLMGRAIEWDKTPHDSHPARFHIQPAGAP